MTEATITVKGGTIALPKTLRRSWNGAQLLVRVSRDTLVMKKVQSSSFWDTWKSLRSVGKKITRKDIANAVAWSKKSSRS